MRFVFGQRPESAPKALQPEVNPSGSEYPNSKVLGPNIHTLSGFWSLKPCYYFDYLGTWTLRVACPHKGLFVGACLVPGLYLKDDMTLKSRGPIPLYYEASMVYESSNLLGFIASQDI